MIEGDPVIDREVADGPRKTFYRVRSDTLEQLETAVSLTQGYQPIDPHFGDVEMMRALGEKFVLVTEIINKSESDGRLIKTKPDRQDGNGLLPCPFCGNEADYYPSNEAVFSVSWIGHIVHCKTCQARVQTAVGEKTAREMWNNRATQSPTRDAAEGGDDLSPGQFPATRATSGRSRNATP